jgi:ADP-ribosylglycohydrolase
LLRADGDVARFRRVLAWRMRLWLLTLPAGIGLATLRSLILLWCGVPPTRSGVWSAGNGPLMRAPLIGCRFASDATRRREFVDAATRMTHRDPQVLTAARALADVAAAIARGDYPRAPAVEGVAHAAACGWRRARMEGDAAAPGRLFHRRRSLQGGARGLRQRGRDQRLRAAHAAVCAGRVAHAPRRPDRPRWKR